MTAPVSVKSKAKLFAAIARLVMCVTGVQSAQYERLTVAGSAPFGPRDRSRRCISFSWPVAPVALPGPKFGLDPLTAKTSDLKAAQIPSEKRRLRPRLIQARINPVALQSQKRLKIQNSSLARDATKRIFPAPESQRCKSSVMQIELFALGFGVRN
jgi:hypothetical protein